MPFRLYRGLGGVGHEAFWRGLADPSVEFTDRSGVRFGADLRDWLERQHYFCGYPEVANLLLLRERLGPGDTFVDIGANRGVLSLHAAQRVGSGGRVISFEPNPTTFAALQANIARNPRLQVEPHMMALGDAPGTLKLTSASGHHGHFTLRPGEAGGSQVEVRVERGDAVLNPAQIRGRCLVKIDTEGYELQVLAGLGGLLDRLDTAFLIEVTDEWLRRSGGSAAELFARLASHGFRAWLPKHRPFGGLGYRLTLEPLDGPPSLAQFDAFFTRD